MSVLIDPVTPIDYSSTDVPLWYKCENCEKNGVKLWRTLSTFLVDTTLLCFYCAIASSGLHKGEDYSTMTKEGMHWGVTGFTDQLPFGVAAIPTMKGDTFWGYNSAPDDGVDWWKRLPLRG